MFFFFGEGGGDDKQTTAKNSMLRLLDGLSECAGNDCRRDFAK